jgi:cell division protein FtsA
MSRMAAAIDIGTSKIAIVVGRLDERGALVVAGAGLEVYAGFKDDEWLDMASLEEAVLTARKTAEKQSGRRIKDVYVSVPGEFIQAAFNHAEVKVRNRDRIITREDVSRLIEETGNYEHPAGYLALHRTPVAYIADGMTRYKPPIGEQAQWLSGYVSHVLAMESFIEEIGSILSSLGLGILGFIAGPMATGYLARTDSEGKHTAVVVDAGHYSMDVMVAEGDGLVFHENMPFGGSSITRDIAVVMNMPLHEAEKLKKQLVLGVDRSNVLGEKQLVDNVTAQEIAESRVWDMGRRVAQSLEKLGLAWDGQTGVYLTGGGLGMMRGAKDILGSCLGKIVKPYSHQSPMLGGPAFTGAAATLFYALSMNRGTSLRELIGRIKDLF